MRNHRKVLYLLMSACFLAATTALAQTGRCSLQRLNFPAPATNGNAVALNDAGGIVGTYSDSNKVSHGFLLFQGRLTSFMFPGSSSTNVNDMSSNGIIVGDYTVAGDPTQHHFMVHSGGFHEITLPGFPNTDFTVTGVNANGDVVGTINTDTVPNNGYVLHNGKITFLLVPGSVVTQPTSINNAGVVIGGSLAEAVNENPAFIWKDGVFTNLDPPGNDGFPSANKISNSGVIVGGFTDVGGFHAFALKNGTFTVIDVPGFEDISMVAVNKFDNVLVQATQITSQGLKPGLFKGFCAAAF